MNKNQCRTKTSGKIATCFVVIILIALIFNMKKAHATEGDLVSITFNDVNMYNAMVNELGDKVTEKSDKTIKMTQENIDKVTSIALEEKEISDITGIKKFTKLESLNLGSNKIKDITAIESLANLKTLYLPNNQINNIDSLKKLSNLEGLSLGKNNLDSEGYKVLSDMTDNGNFSNLKGLWLWELGITDLNQINFIKNLKGLTLLDLHGNGMSDISGLKELTNLNTLYLFNNKIKDINTLEGLTNLVVLNLYNNEISDISALEGLTNLTSLGLNENEISDISALEGLTNLTLLKLERNKINKSDIINVLSDKNKLDYLSLSLNDINEISEIANHVKSNYIIVYSPNEEEIVKSVTVSIIANEEVQEVPGWELSENKKILTKIYTKNIEESVTIKKLSGATKSFTIEIKDIQKSQDQENNGGNNTEDNKGNNSGNNNKEDNNGESDTKKDTEDNAGEQNNNHKTDGGANNKQEMFDDNIYNMNEGLANKRIPQTGTTYVIISIVGALAVVGAISYIRYKNVK